MPFEGAKTRQDRFRSAVAFEQWLENFSYPEALLTWCRRREVSAVTRMRSLGRVSYWRLRLRPADLAACRGREVCAGSSALKSDASFFFFINWSGCSYKGDSGRLLAACSVERMQGTGWIPDSRPAACSRWSALGSALLRPVSETKRDRKCKCRMLSSSESDGQLTSAWAANEKFSSPV